MASLRKKGKVWYFRFTDSEGVKKERKGCPDRRATEEMGRAAETQAAKIRAGMVAPEDVRLAEHGRRSLGSHLGDFHAQLLARGNTAKHAALTLDRARRVSALALGASLSQIDPPRSALKPERERAASVCSELLGSGRLSDLTPARVQSALAALRDAGRSLATCNHHRAAIRGFSRWAWKDGRLRQDPMAGVSGFNAKEDRRHDRRTLGLDDLRRLIEAAHRGEPYRGMSGPDRAICYRLAVATGLRFSEIASMSPASFSLDGPENPAVTVRAAYTKNGEPATLPIPGDLASDLREWLARRPGAGPAFALPDRGADMLKVDLEAAGIAYRDAGGLVFDFHSLRCQCATLLDRAGVTPRVVQRTMRHSTLELTGKYTRPRPVDLEQAVGSLPSLRPGMGAFGPEAQRATGTADQSIGEHFSHHLPTGAGGEERELTAPGVFDGKDVTTSMGRKMLMAMG